MWSPQCLPPHPLRDILFVNFIGKLKRKENEPGPNLYNQHSFPSWSNFKKNCKEINQETHSFHCVSPSKPARKQNSAYLFSKSGYNDFRFPQCPKFGQVSCLQAPTSKMLILVCVLKEIYFLSKWSHS